MVGKDVVKAVGELEIEMDCLLVSIQDHSYRKTKNPDTIVGYTVGLATAICKITGQDRSEYIKQHNSMAMAAVQNEKIDNTITDIKEAVEHVRRK